MWQKRQIYVSLEYWLKLRGMGIEGRQCFDWRIRCRRVLIILEDIDFEG